MDKKFEAQNLHQKMEVIIKEMVEKELPLKDALKEFQKIFIETAVKKYKGNWTIISKALGVHRNTLHNLAKNLKIKKNI
jgi:DNA-binding NtrC family response regulator